MALDSDLKLLYPELTDFDFVPNEGTIHLVDDGDGIVYINKWEYVQPLPEGAVIGKENIQITLDSIASAISALTSATTTEPTVTE